MRVDIVYNNNSDAEFLCCAETEIRGVKYFGIGKTWEQSKENLLKKVNALMGQTPPAPETVEIKVASEEMDTELLPWEDKFNGVVGRIIEPGKV
jgi:hypothetical protein